MSCIFWIKFEVRFLLFLNNANRSFGSASERKRERVNKFMADEFY